jgi:hypothetical protein
MNTEFDSTLYWRRRYRQGGNSGPGSYGRLAIHKADIINSLVYRHDIESVIEFGSGDGNQLSLFHIPRYVGIDVSEDMVAACQDRYADDPGRSFHLRDTYEVPPRGFDMSLSLDVIYHLVEDERFHDYMTDLFAAADRYVLIYASDREVSGKAKHVRQREYSKWIERHAPDWKVERTFENPFARRRGSDPETTSFAFFRLFARQS